MTDTDLIIWRKADAYFLAKPLAEQLAGRFGPVGLVVWQAFLDACKRNPIQGRISYTSEAHAEQVLLLELVLPLRDAEGKEFTLEEFWEFTGKHKQTRRTRRGRIINVIATHWERWNNSQKTEDARERKRRSRAINGRDGHVTQNEREKEKEKGVVTRSQKPPTPEPPAYPEWTPETPQGEKLVDIKAALAQIRRGEEPDG